MYVYILIGLWMYSLVGRLREGNHTKSGPFASSADFIFGLNVDSLALSINRFYSPDIYSGLLKVCFCGCLTTG